MSNSLNIEEILVHPAFPTVLEFHTPDRQGTAPVASNRAGGPISIAYEVHGTGPVHLVVRRIHLFRDGRAVGCACLFSDFRAFPY